MSTNPFENASKAVLIKGATTGIGRSPALAFASNGANVFVGDVELRANDTCQID